MDGQVANVVEYVAAQMAEHLFVAAVEYFEVIYDPPENGKSNLCDVFIQR